MRSLIVVSVVCGVVLWGAQEARSQGVAQAKRHFKVAEEHFAAGRYRAALESYQAAYRAKPLPGFHFNIGQCYQNLGDFEQAVHHFEQYIKLSKNDQHKADAERLIDLCKGKMLERKLEKDDGQDEEPPPFETGEPLKAQKIEDPEHEFVPEPEDPRGFRRLHPAFFYSGIGVSVALIVTCSITGAVALDKSREFKDESTPTADLRDIKNSGESFRSASSTTFGLALLTGAITTALYFFTDFSRRESTVSAAPLSGGGAVMTMGGRF